MINEGLTKEEKDIIKKMFIDGYLFPDIHEHLSNLRGPDKPYSWYEGDKVIYPLYHTDSYRLRKINVRRYGFIKLDQKEKFKESFKTAIDGEESLFCDADFLEEFLGKPIKRKGKA